MNHFDVHTSVENLNLTFFPKKIEYKIPKLFQGISFLKGNKNLMTTAMTDHDKDGKIDMAKLLTIYQDANRMVKFSTDHLNECLSQTEDFTNFSTALEQH